MNKTHKMATLVIAAILAAGMTAPTAYADSPGNTRITASEQSVLTQILGHKPTQTEYNRYVETYGSVPTEADINAYIEASESEGSSSQTAAHDDSTSPGTSTEIYTQAAPARFSMFFLSGTWITRSGVVSLSLKPRKGGIGNEGDERTWKTVYDKFHNAGQRTRYKNNGVDASMKKQYMCHFKYGMVKTPWNLEPHKKAADVSPVKCN